MILNNNIKIKNFKYLFRIKYKIVMYLHKMHIEYIFFNRNFQNFKIIKSKAKLLNLKMF